MYICIYSDSPNLSNPHSDAILKSHLNKHEYSTKLNNNFREQSSRDSRKPGKKLSSKPPPKNQHQNENWRESVLQKQLAAVIGNPGNNPLITLI